MELYRYIRKGRKTVIPVRQGVCGTKTDMFDDKGSELFIGDQVVIVAHLENAKRGKWDDILGVEAVVNDDDGAYVMGLKSLDLTKPKGVDNPYRTHWDIVKCKSFEECVVGEVSGSTHYCEDGKYEERR
jgi:hypothetical protein